MVLRRPSLPAAIVTLSLVLLMASAPAMAYIGPGAGVSLVGAVWSVIVGIVLVVGAILSWPLRLLWKRLRRGKSGRDAGTGGPPEGPAT